MGRTWRAIRVPVSSLISAVIATAAGPNRVPSGGSIVPLMVAGGDAGTVSRGTSTWLVGPPVMTGTPTAFCQTFVPSTTVAYRP